MPDFPVRGFVEWIDHISALNARMLKGVDRQLRASGHSSPVRRILVGILNAPDCTDRELGIQLGMQQSQISRNLADVITRGLVEQKEAPRHRSQRLLNLTMAGRELAVNLDERSKAAFDLELKDLSLEDQAILMRASDAQYTYEQHIRPTGKLSLHEVEVDAWGWILMRAARLARDELDWREAYVADVALMISANLEQSQEWSRTAWVATIEGRSAGACLMTVGTDSVRSVPDAVHGTIGLLFVEPNFRGRGVGGRLLKQCIAAARDRTLIAISMRVSDSQKDLLALLKAHKFRPRHQSRSDRRYGPLNEWREYVLDIGKIPRVTIREET